MRPSTDFTHRYLYTHYSAQRLTTLVSSFKNSRRYLMISAAMPLGSLILLFLTCSNLRTQRCRLQLFLSVECLTFGCLWHGREKVILQGHDQSFTDGEECDRTRTTNMCESHLCVFNATQSSFLLFIVEQTGLYCRARYIPPRAMVNGLHRCTRVPKTLSHLTYLAIVIYALLSQLSELHWPVLHTYTPESRPVRKQRSRDSVYLSLAPPTGT